MIHSPTELRLFAAEDLLRDLVGHEDRPCRFDHHGYCQEHGWLDESTCVVRRGRDFLGLDALESGDASAP